MLDSIADRDVEFDGQNWPGMHGEHRVADESEYKPLGQAMHCGRPPDEKVPARQSEGAAEPAGQYRPSGQSRHRSVPGRSAKVPAGHGEHAVCPDSE